MKMFEFRVVDETREGPEGGPYIVTHEGPNRAERRARARAKARQQRRGQRAYDRAQQEREQGEPVDLGLDDLDG
jgi:hypothetical protein